MNFNTQICTTREQSNRLLALGVKKETADCCWVGCVKDARGNDISSKKQVWFTRTNSDESAIICGLERYEFVLAWSLHRLIAMYPDFVIAEQKNHERLYEQVIANIKFAIEEGTFDEKYLEE